MLPNKPKDTGVLSQDEQLRIAFDGDAVLFSDETERMFRERGLDAVAQNEKFHANTPLPNGPFYAFARALSNTQAMCSTESYPIRTALVTARSAPAHERVIRTLRAWGIRIDEAYFLGGRSILMPWSEYSSISSCLAFARAIPIASSAIGSLSSAIPPR